ncbi:MAG: hypothetical protein RIB77_46785 [Sandaracinaceae bacterium]|nr:MAG: hypothetical protein EVA89_01135 [Sandaracinaceae bacterium]
MISPRRALLCLSVPFLLLLGACGSDAPCDPSDCAFGGADFRCPDDSACGGFSRVASCSAGGNSCNLECEASASCAGTCADSCNLSCDATDCTLLTGDSSSVVCTEGADCDVTCQGNSCSLSCQSGSSCDFTCEGESCSMSCAADASCRMRCPGDDGLQPVTEGRSC